MRQIVLSIAVLMQMAATTAAQEQLYYDKNGVVCKIDVSNPRVSKAPGCDMGKYTWDVTNSCSLPAKLYYSDDNTKNALISIKPNDRTTVTCCAFGSFTCAGRVWNYDFKQ